MRPDNAVSIPHCAACLRSDAKGIRCPVCRDGVEGLDVGAVQLKCKHCGARIYERTSGYFDNVDVREWPCVDYQAHEPEEQQR